MLVLGTRGRRKSCLATPGILASSFLGGMGQCLLVVCFFFFLLFVQCPTCVVNLRVLAQVKRGVQTAPGTAQRAGPCGQWTVDSGVWLDRLTGNVPWFNNV